MRRTIGNGMRLSCAVLGAGLLVAGIAPHAVAAKAPAGRWSMAWRSENAFPTTIPTTETCRFVALLTGAGSRVRAEFTAPLASGGHYTISRAAIALSTGPNLDVPPGTRRYPPFGGKQSATASSGKTLVTDFAPMNVRNSTSVAVTIV